MKPERSFHNTFPSAEPFPHSSMKPGTRRRKFWPMSILLSFITDSCCALCLDLAIRRPSCRSFSLVKLFRNRFSSANVSSARPPHYTFLPHDSQLWDPAEVIPRWKCVRRAHPFSTPPTSSHSLQDCLPLGVSERASPYRVPNLGFCLTACLVHPSTSASYRGHGR